MKPIRIIISIIIFSNISAPCFSQTIVKRVNNYVLIDANQSNGMKINDRFDIYHNDPFEGKLKIGEIKIFKFKNNKCVGWIINEDDKYPISKGDYIKIIDRKDILDEAIISTGLFEEHEKNYPIIKVTKQYAVIDANRNDGIDINDILTVKRLTGADKTSVGKIKIIMFRDNMCVGKIIFKKSGYNIARNDFIEITNKYAHSSNSLSYWTLGLGLFSSGIGYYYYNKANQTYNDYQTATTTPDAIRLYDETGHQANRANYGFGIGGGLLVFSLVYHLITQSPKTPYSRPTYSMIPYQNGHSQGLTFQISLK